MADIRIHSAKMNDGKVEELEVELQGLDRRTINRATAIAWLRDGHSLIPWIAGQRGASLRLHGPEDSPSLHATDAQGEGDTLGDLPMR